MDDSFYDPSPSAEDVKEPISQSKRPRAFGLIDRFVREKEHIQTTVEDRLQKKERKHVISMIVKYFYQAGIPFNTAR